MTILVPFGFVALVLGRREIFEFNLYNRKNITNTFIYSIASSLAAPGLLQPLSTKYG